jgi:hypothetical protein
LAWELALELVRVRVWARVLGQALAQESVLVQGLE